MKKFLIAILFTASVAIMANGQGRWAISPPQANGDLISVYFTSSKEGWIAGDKGYLAFTNDGGKTWARKNLNTDADINEIYFRDDDHGYLVAGRKMFQTSDRGRTWREDLNIVKEEEFVKGIPEFLSIRFNSKDQGFIVGSIVDKEHEDIIIGSLILRTMDGGKSWSRIVVPSKIELFHLDFDGKSRGWIVGDEGTILATVDNGNSWVQQISGTKEALYNVDFRGDRDGYAVGGKGTLLVTNDGGRTWRKKSLNTDRSLFRVDFPSDDEGWIVGRDGVIFRTEDKGANWRLFPSVTKSTLYGLYIEKKFGWSVGKGGVVIKYER